ncbi:ParB family protein [Pseudomonas sp. WHRI 8519]|uniref:ParB family protein n=1 Tax=Pseudomonas sp. WHRI 8519 TaxID=3162567 RepID=UPI0032EF98C0
MKPPTSEDITRQLQQAHFPQKHDRDLAKATVGDTPMVVTLEQLRSYELNPRVVRNPLYDDIKASIRERGLDQPPAITRRPNERHFIIRNGGNTRLSILGELWQETREERFFRIHCLFRPWQSESHALLGHLAESDLHGQLTFIERALAVAKLQGMFEPGDTRLTQRELAARLSEGGYPISQSHISRMFDVLEHLLPAIPQMLYAGLGKSAIVRLISLRRRAESIWNRYFGAPEQFPLLWFEVLSAFDGEKPELDSGELQDDLIARMAVSLEQTPRLLALELHQEQRPSLPPADSTPTPQSTPAGELAKSSSSPVDPPEAPTAVPNPEPTKADAGLSAQQAPRLPDIRQALGDEPLPDKPLEEREYAPTLLVKSPSDAASLEKISALRASCASLAAELAVYADAGDMVNALADDLGFTLSPGHGEHSPRHTGIQLLLSALLRLQDDVAWKERQQLPAALFGQLLIGVYDLPFTDRPALTVGLERLPDAQLEQLFTLILHARHLIELTLSSTR